MKFIIILLALFSAQAFSSCLSNVNSLDFITSKVRGIYATNDQDQYHYIILDKTSCSVEVDGKSTYISHGTKSAYYIQFNKAGTFLQSVILTAYAKGESVKFKLGQGQHGYNSILYAIIPHNATMQ